IPEACQLIIQAAASGSPAAIYTLDMGDPVPIQLLAEQMIWLAGHQPGRHDDILYPGLPPGERPPETLFHSDEHYRPTSHPKILEAGARNCPVDLLFQEVDHMRAAVSRYDENALRQALQMLVPEFAPRPVAPQENTATVVPFPPREAVRTR